MATKKSRTTASTRSQPNAPATAGPGVPVTRVATYRRASTDEENQPYSLDAQGTKLEAYVASQDSMVVVCDYEEYASAKDIEGRPQLLRLLEDAAAGKFDTVVVHKVDRWSRRLADLLATVEFLHRHGVAFASATEPIDTTTPLGRMVLQILGSFAEFERGLIVERVTRGIEEKVSRGIPQGGVGYGLRKDSAGTVVKDEATFGVVERIFREYTAGELGTKAIAQGLQGDGLPSPGTRPWGAQAVARILRNRTFVGDVPFRDGWVEGRHDALIDPDVFDAAQAIADRRSDQSGASRTRGNFVLTGTILCAHCGGAYSGNTGTSKNKTKVRYYSCQTSRRYGRATCAGPSVPADELEEQVAEALVGVYADSHLFAQAVEQHLAQRHEQVDPLESELAAARASVAQKQRVLDRYQSDYEAGSLDASLYSQRTQTLRNELDGAATRIAQLELELAHATAVPTPTDEDRAQLHELLAARIKTGPVPVRKALFAALVARLEVHDVDDIRPTFRLGGHDLARIDEANEPAEPAGDVAPAQSVFANRTPGWS